MLMLISGILVVISLASLAGIVAASLDHAKSWSDGTWFKFGTTGFCHVAILALIHFFLKVHQTSWKEFLGLNSAQWRVGILVGGVTGILMVPALLLVNEISSLVLKSFRVVPVEQQVVVIVKSHSGSAQRLALAAAALVFAPLVEESIFRGILYPAIRQRGHMLIALLFTSLLFAAIHANLMTFFPLFLFAIILVVLYELTDVLLTSMVAHAVFNAVNFLLLIYETPLTNWFQHLWQSVRERI